MTQRVLIIWISAVGVIGILFGLFYAFFGLSGFPAYHALVDAKAMVPWSNGLYGAVFIGFSVLLLGVGRYAFKKLDAELMRLLLFGLVAWLLVEAAFSIYYGVYFNVGVDVVLGFVLGWPLLLGLRSSRN